MYELLVQMNDYNKEKKIWVLGKMYTPDVIFTRIETAVLVLGNSYNLSLVLIILETVYTLHNIDGIVSVGMISDILF